MMTVRTYLAFLLMGFSVYVFYSCDYESDTEHMDEQQLLFPNDGETLIQGNTYTITWRDEISNAVRIRLMKSGEILSKLSENYPNTGEFIWTIPDSLEVAYGYTIKILSNNSDFIYSESMNPFKILEKSDTASFTDPRDGQVYKTVRLSDTWWMAQNFNYDTAGSYCYANNEMNCATYGRLYTIGAAKSACPPGWHLPTDREWRVLEACLGIPEEAIYADGFRGTNAGYLLTAEDGVGFNAKYAGYMYRRYYNRFYSLDQATYFWTSSTDESGTNYWVRQLIPSSGGINRTQMNGYYYAFSVRLVKDN